MKPPHLSPFVEAGSLVFLSGQLAMGPDRQIVHDGVGEQTSQVLANIDSLLGRLGLGRTDVIKTTVWLRSGADFVAFNDAYAEFFGDHRPARSTVYSQLALPAAAVEIEAVALRKGA
jgi:2-iminobutanoate/2-iminopropanoate deaminase